MGILSDKFPNAEAVEQALIENENGYVKANQSDETATASDFVTASNSGKDVCYSVIDLGSDTSSPAGRTLASNFAITGNRITSEGYGLFIGDSYTQQGTRNVKAIANDIVSFKGNRARNFDVSEGNVIFLANSIETTGATESGDDVGIEAWSKKVTIIGNDIYKNGRGGYSGITAAYGKSIVSGNHITGFTGGMEIASDLSVVTSNIIDGSRYGLYFGAPIINAITISDCVFHNVDECVHIEGGSQITLINNCIFYSDELNTEGYLLYHRLNAQTKGKIIFNNCHFKNYRRFDLVAQTQVEFNNCEFDFDTPNFLSINKNCNFNNCTFNGGVRVGNGTSNFVSCTFTNYSGLANGAAISKQSGTNPAINIQHCNFDNPNDSTYTFWKTNTTTEFAQLKGGIVNDTYLCYNGTADLFDEGSPFLQLVSQYETIFVRDLYTFGKYISYNYALHDISGIDPQV